MIPEESGSEFMEGCNLCSGGSKNVLKNNKFIRQNIETYNKNHLDVYIYTCAMWMICYTAKYIEFREQSIISFD